MLIGSYQHTVDSKGRIFVPSKLKNDLGDQFVIVRGIEENLMVFPKKEFERFVEKYQELPIADTEAQDFFRLFFASASMCETDKQGRVVIPQELRDFAGINENVVIVGMVTRLEIWTPEKFKASSNIEKGKYSKVLSSLAQRGV